MTYCTQQNMIDRFGIEELTELTDREQLGEIGQAALDAAIADATADIDMYLAVRYTLPLSIVPAVLTRLCCDIARFYLHGNNVPEHINDRHDAAIELLESIAKGDIDLAVGQDSGGSGDVLYESGGDPVFDESSQSWP